MSRYIFDAWAWAGVEYLIGSQFGVRLKEILDEDNSEVYTCTITLGQVIGKVAREGRDAETAYDILQSNSKVANANEVISFQAGLLICEMRKTLRDFRLADAYVLAAARKLGTKVLTGDIHFKNVKDAISIK